MRHCNLLVYNSRAGMGRDRLKPDCSEDLILTHRRTRVQRWVFCFLGALLLLGQFEKQGSLKPTSRPDPVVTS